MAVVTFYEKPGCRNNTRQKALLQASGHQVEARNLLTEPWTPETLRPFFGARPVVDWFNKAAPRVKSGEIDPASFSPQAALELMCAEPLLIRRPLMEANGRRETGFDEVLVHGWIGLADPDQPMSEACPRSDGHACEPPHTNGQNV